MIVGPGCIHPSGGQYKILVGPDDCDLAVAPSLLMDLADGRVTNGPNDATVDLNAGPIPDGARDDTLTRIAGHLFRVHPAPKVAEELHQINAHRCKPPLPDRDVDRIIASIGKREAGKPSSESEPPGEPSKTSRLALVPFYKIEVGTCGAYLVKGLIPREGLIVVWGPPKCGKSFWTFDLVMHVALGREYRGRRVQQGPVVYVACEGAHGFRARIEAYRQCHLEDHNEAVPFYLVPARISLVEEHQELIAEIRKPLGATSPVAVVIDTLNRSLTGSENSDEDMSNFVKAADAIYEAFDCAVLIVHHCGVEGTRPRGHTSLSGAVEAQLAVKRNADGLVTTKLEYMKDGPEGDEIHFRLEQVEIGSDDDGNRDAQKNTVGPASIPIPALSGP